MPNEKVNSEKYVDGYDAIFGGQRGVAAIAGRRKARRSAERRRRKVALLAAQERKARLQFAGAPGQAGRSLRGGHRIHVEALAVHPEDAADAQLEATKAGIDVIVRPEDGTMDFGSVRDYDRYTKLRGFFNKDGQTPRG